MILPPPFNVDIDGHPGFVMLPPRIVRRPIRWVWYAPAFDAELPSERHRFLLERMLGAGLAFAGIDVGESYGSPAGRAVYTAFHQHVTTEFGLARQATLLPQSRGGLMHYTWASEHPRLVRRIAGIYTVCDMRSWPGLETVAPAYGYDVATLEAELHLHNPIELVRPLARVKVPVLHIHGDSDVVVPLEANSGELARRYVAAGGDMQLIVVPGKGHEEVDEFFCSEVFARFLVG